MIDSVSESASRRRNPSPSPNGVDRLPPHSVEAEQGVLGCILLSPTDCLGQCIEKLKAGEAAFYDLRHQIIFTELVAMYDSKAAGIDLITLQQRLKDRQLLEQIGGVKYLQDLQECVPSAANLAYYIDIVREKHTLRRIIHTCTDTVGRIYDYEGETAQLLDEVERDMLSFRQDENITGRRDTKVLVNNAISAIERKFNRAGELGGLATGFADLDRMTDGFQNGNMIVIAARPSMGKTSLCMNIVEHVALELKLPVGVFTLEMTADELMQRAMCSRARVNLRNINEGFMSEADFPKLTSAAGKLSKSPLYIDDTSGLSIMQLRARARRLWQEFQIKLFVVDYLQLLHSTATRAKENRAQEIGDISAGIKGLAKELNVPVLVASQLNREVERDKGRKPKLSDLRESGCIEQDADVVGLLYKPANNDDEDSMVEEPDGVAVNLLIAKQRNGPTGDVQLTFLRPYTRFESAARVSSDDVPSDSYRQREFIEEPPPPT